MVNFNDDTTMTRPRKDIVNIMILQELQNLLEAITYFEMRKGKDRENGLPELKSTLLSIITLIRTPLEAKLEKDKKGTIKELRQTIYDIDYDHTEELYEIIDYVEKFLYTKDVTKWDTKEQQDRTDILQMNSKVLGRG